METEALEKDIQDFVIARLKSMPENLELAVGNEGSFSIPNLIEHVKENDEIGKMYIETQLEYMRSLNNLPINDEGLPDYES
ncbi:MAG: hypothetical protein HYW97_00535 [Candidatus Wildermuthbacteria bacterium]|nr:hypothetical protein [Candidatus Wildermuthbacteria bacterium]